MSIDTSAVEAYLKNYARPIDRALYDFHFNPGGAESVISALQSFQNEDGGFGHSLEADLGMPESSALATSVAIQYLTAIGAGANEPITRRVVRYLVDSYLPEATGWAIVGKETDNYPHAPWWDYEAAMAGFGWGNPSAELLGFLLSNGNGQVPKSLIASGIIRALDRLEQLSTTGDPDFHELLCFVRLNNAVDEPLRSKLRRPLDPLIACAVSSNPDDWSNYGATPLTFATRPDSPFSDLFETNLIEQNLDLVEESIANDHWEPNWDWGGAYPDDWERARQDWCGKITVNNVIMLRAYGRVS